MPKKLKPKYLEKKRVPKVLIAGLIMASVLGWTGWQNLDKIKNYYEIKTIFPDKTMAVSVIDGDTFTISNGLSVRLLGIDAPNRGEQNYSLSQTALSTLISQKSLSLEYDSYQDDKYGRILAYVWITCESEIKQFCRGDKALINEIMLKMGLAEKVVYSKRKRLKYEDFLIVPSPPSSAR